MGTGKWAAYRAEGFMSHLQRGGGGETLVDDALHGQILAEVLRHDASAEGWHDAPVAPHRLVLVTGDGNDNGGACSFPECITRALDKRWEVELWSWRAGLSRRFVQLAAGSEGHMRVRYLDDLPAMRRILDELPQGAGVASPTKPTKPAKAVKAAKATGAGAVSYGIKVDWLQHGARANSASDVYAIAAAFAPFGEIQSKPSPTPTQLCKVCREQSGLEHCTC